MSTYQKTTSESASTQDTATDVKYEGSSGAFDVPIVTISAAGKEGVSGVGNIEHPGYQVETIAAPTGNAGFGLLDIPRTTVEGIGTTEIGGETWQSAMESTLPYIEAVGVNGYLGTGDLTLPVVETDGGNVGLGIGSLILPFITISTGTLDATGAGAGAGLATASLTHPGYTLDGDGLAEGIATASLPYQTVYRLTIEGTGLADSTVEADLIGIVPTIYGEGASGATGEAAVTVPIIDLDGAGYFAVTGTGNLEIIHSYLIQASGHENIIGTETFDSVISMNTDNKAVTEYSSYAFNSFCKYNGTYLGANSSGIFRLEGSDDDGSEIAVDIQKIRMDLGSTQLKRSTDAFIHLSAGGSFVVNSITEDASSGDIAVTEYRSGFQTNKVNLPRGLKGRFIGIRIRNADGDSIEVEDIELIVELLRQKRKYGSMDTGTATVTSPVSSISAEG